MAPMEATHLRHFPPSPYIRVIEWKMDAMRTFLSSRTFVPVWRQQRQRQARPHPCGRCSVHTGQDGRAGRTPCHVSAADTHFRRRRATGGRVWLAPTERPARRVGATDADTREGGRGQGVKSAVRCGGGLFFLPTLPTAVGRGLHSGHWEGRGGGGVRRQTVGLPRGPPCLCARRCCRRGRWRTGRTVSTATSGRGSCGCWTTRRRWTRSTQTAWRRWIVCWSRGMGGGVGGRGEGRHLRGV